MRNLVIKRNKTFVGCAATLKVYISDPISGDLTIHGTLCRKLGTLKNGETMIFPIGEEEARIYVIADKLSRKLDCEYCTLPAGNQDIFISGKCQFDPIQGNPFHFDGNVSAPKNRKRSVIMGIGICVAATVIGAVVGFVLPSLLLKEPPSQPKTFTAEGMQITLTDAFQEADFSEYGFTLGYASKDTAIYVLKEEFTLSAGFSDISLQDYVQLVIANNDNLRGQSATQEQGQWILEYTTRNPEDGKIYSYLIVFLKGPDAFWMFEFSTHADNAQSMRQTYLDYAATICFPDAAI